MKGSEVAAWCQVVLGVGSLFVAVLTGLPVLEGLQAAAQGATEEGSGLTAAAAVLTVFAFMIAFMAGLLLFALGFSAVLGFAFQRIGANAPHAAAYLVVLCALLCAAAATLGVLGLHYWPVPLALAGLCLFLSGIAQMQRPAVLWTVAALGTAVAILVGGGAASLIWSDTSGRMIAPSDDQASANLAAPKA